MPTIGSTLRATARRSPDAEALRFGNEQYTYAELDAAVDRTATALSGLGLAKGDRFALMATNSDRFVIAFYAAQRLGAIFVPINPASAPPELRYLLADSGAKIFVFDPALADTVEAAGAGGFLPPTVRHSLSLGECQGHEDLMALAARASALPVEDTVSESDDALILYTSGTTGEPKGALFDHHRSMWVAFSAVATNGMRVGDRLLHVAPLYHAAELCLMLVPGTLVAAKHVLLSGFDPAVLLETLESERITAFFGVPTMFQLMLRHPDLPERDLSAWRAGTFGAAPMPAATVQQLVSVLPHVQWMQVCGQTEGGPGGIYADTEQVKARPDASGRQASLFVEARVVDSADRDVAPGEVGELILRGETIMKGYWNKPAETAQALRGGWLRTGDLARVDADGFMTLVDRLKDMIITGGRNVYSVEVENALAAHPDVADAAVVARPHPDYGESIVAVIVPRKGATVTVEGVKDFCRQRIARYKVPHDVVITTRIPRNPSGKILKHRLRAELAAAPTLGQEDTGDDA
jgi:acyl-CoA synthetase (AMP-forming)/AMP-acid ligase II